MKYSIRFNCAYKEVCSRCGAPLQTAVVFYQGDILMTVGRECAKHYGITWTPAVGPMAEDPNTFQQAIAIWQQRQKMRFGWPNGWDACKEIKDALGTKVWRRAMYAASNQTPTICPHPPEAQQVVTHQRPNDGPDEGTTSLECTSCGATLS